MRFRLVWLLIFAKFCCAKLSFIQAIDQSLDVHENIETILQNTFSLMLTGASDPVCIIHCPDSLENRLVLASEISKLYGTFLTPEIHEEELCETLNQKGMWIQKRYFYHPIPTPFQISLFMSTLEQELLHHFEETEARDAAFVHLGYDYGPTSTVLEVVFEAVGLNADFYYLLPYKSHTHIYIHDEEIILNINFKGPPI